ncbi:MAG: hypothetical protein MJ097_05195 [Dorea sp.]|nr:hypothetical protein [Dorea sp.]
MKKITKHPLRITADAWKQAFSLNGFTLYDNGEYPELEKTEINVKVFNHPEAITKPVLLMEGQYALRTQLLPFSLPHMRSEGNVMGVSIGKVFDGNDIHHPAHLVAEGIVASDRNHYDYNYLWKKLVKAALGAGYEAELVSVGKSVSKADLQSWGASAMKETTLNEQNTWAIEVTDPEAETFIIGYTGTLTWLGQALLGVKAESIYAFSLDLDYLACKWLGIESREKLFDNRQEFLDCFTDGSISASEAFEDRCRDVLRTMGYSEGYGPKIYPDGIYKKMNMIQDEWDLNNKGVLLKEPLGESVGLPTVLTPALEQILSEKWKAGEKEAKTFEVSHIFMPQSGAAPIEKLAISFGAYGENMTLKAFIAETDKFLTKIGNKNHFFLPNNMAIAYKINECRLILDEKMNYLGGNFGGISEKAEANFGIETHAYMANLEIKPLAEKAAEEYGYIAPELR